MRRYLLTLAAVLVLLTGCGDDSDEATPDTDAGAVTALETVVEQIGKAQYGQAYRTLHPSLQAQFDEATFVACRQAAEADNISLSGLEVTDVETVEPIETKVPGTDETIQATAVTAELTLNGESFVDTYTMVDSPEGWRWITEVTDCLTE